MEVRVGWGRGGEAGRKPQPRQVGKWGRESEIGGLEEEEDASFACLVLLLRICVSEPGHKKGG